LSAGLEALGFDVLPVSNSREALPALRKNGGGGMVMIAAGMPAYPILLVRRRETPRKGTSADNGQISIGGIELDPERRTVRKYGLPIGLAQREFEVLHHLMKHCGRPVTHQALIEAAWGAGCVKRREHLRRIVCILRKKLEDHATDPRYLLTESSFGYRFCEDTPL
jgi:DNA-binding response OmpR family regulator